MSRNNSWDSRRLGGKQVNQWGFEVVAQTLGAALSLDPDAPTILALDPGGATRSVVMPAINEQTKGRAFIIINTADAAEDLNIRNPADSATLGTIGGSVGGTANEMALVIEANGAWRVGVMTTT